MKQSYQKNTEHIEGVLYTGANIDEISEFIGRSFKLDGNSAPGTPLFIFNGNGQHEMKLHLGEFIYREVSATGVQGSNRLQKMAPQEIQDWYKPYDAEAAILAAQYAVERMPAHEMLTEAVKNLEDAMVMVRRYNESAAAAGV